MSPKAGEGGGRPQGLSLCSLGAAGARASGRAEARPHARGSRLDVHTELFVYAGASRRTYRIVYLRGSPFGAQKKWCIRPLTPPPPPTPAAASVLMYGRIINANMMDGKQCSWIILSIDKNVHRDSVLVFLSIRPFLKYHL